MNWYDKNLYGTDPASKIHLANIGLMLGHRLRRWHKISSILPHFLCTLSLGANFQKAASFLVHLSRKVAKVFYVYMIGKYPVNKNPNPNCHKQFLNHCRSYFHKT